MNVKLVFRAGGHRTGGYNRGYKQCDCGWWVRDFLAYLPNGVGVLVCERASKEARSEMYLSMLRYFGRHKTTCEHPTLRPTPRCGRPASWVVGFLSHDKKPNFEARCYDHARSYLAELRELGHEPLAYRDLGSRYERVAHIGNVPVRS
jgi:hypothetical protein